MIKVENLTKVYSKNSTKALDNFSYEFEKGKITGLIGLNGAGKSTLLKMLCLILYPTSGSIEIDGIKINPENECKFKEKIGYVSEMSEFYGELKVRELLKNTLEFYDNLSSFDKIVEQTSLSDVLDKKIESLSKGYKQRLSFAIALSNRCEILILDESISGLDPIQIKEIRNLIISLKKDRVIILSTHIMQEIKALCDQIIIIHKGKLLISGTEEEITRKLKSNDIEDAFLKLTCPDKEEKTK
ncbi:MAG: ABC transporter ATP-binding protein [Treponemataceae bacterium]|nr:ABC transporter ATP-binding protein [Treponemataceae bacterium]